MISIHSDLTVSVNGKLKWSACTGNVSLCKFKTHVLTLERRITQQVTKMKMWAHTVSLTAYRCAFTLCEWALHYVPTCTAWPKKKVPQSNISWTAICLDCSARGIIWPQRGLVATMGSDQRVKSPHHNKSASSSPCVKSTIFFWSGSVIFRLI